MSDNHSIPVSNPDDSSLQTIESLLSQGRVKAITIHLEPLENAAPSTTDVQSGTLLRRVLPDSRVVTSWLPDDPLQLVQQDFASSDIAEKTTWMELLGDTSRDIDDGVAFLLLGDDGNVAIWLPNAKDEAPIHVIHQQGANEPGEGGTDRRKFRACVKAQTEAGKSMVNACKHCLPQLVAS